MTQQHPLYAVEGLHLELYDASLETPPAPIDGDVDFYLHQAKRMRGPVLELGCGTGRVAWALAAAGCDVVGLELSDAMRARADAKRTAHSGAVAERVRFVPGDMADFTLSQRFGLVIAPFRAFQHLLKVEDQRRTLLCIRRHLSPSGTVVLQLFDPRLDYLVSGSRGPREITEYLHPKSGRRVQSEVVERHLDQMTQTVDELWRETEFDTSGTVLRCEESRLRLRWTYRWEMRHLFELCGFEVVAEYADFHGAPPAYGREQVWVVKPA